MQKTARKMINHSQMGMRHLQLPLGYLERTGINQTLIPVLSQPAKRHPPHQHKHKAEHWHRPSQGRSAASWGQPHLCSKPQRPCERTQWAPNMSNIQFGTWAGRRQRRRRRSQRKIDHSETARVASHDIAESQARYVRGRLGRRWGTWAQLLARAGNRRENRWKWWGKRSEEEMWFAWSSKFD